MRQTQIVIQNWSDKLAESALALLKKYPETSLSLLSTLQQQGPYQTHEMSSGNYQCLVCNDQVVGVFMMNGFGRLLLQTDRAVDYSKMIIQAVSPEIEKLTGLMGDWDLTQSCLNALQSHFPATQINVCKKEILYRYNLFPLKPFSKNRQVRLLKPKDYNAWDKLNLAFCTELNSVLFSNDAQRESRYRQEVNNRYWWGLFLEGKLSAICTYLAKFENYAQIGGVYTDPVARNQGLAKQLILEVIQDSKNKHGIDYLTLFTHEKNTIAQKVYETLGFKPIGYFGLILCKSH
ncbi:MAG: hypothetical protein A2X77_03055 [Gammaproteobacteria bacterium GWE2_42_36]|nr:MAG: hypothetical protein A2X77_03055 [Gammaproteobacteria bacterium GWE2_42_36]HCU05824.1 hypothetical protein [Coxiellaceae bacterium]